jgi:hypothetical protein
VTAWDRRLATHTLTREITYTHEEQMSEPQILSREEVLELLSQKAKEGSTSAMIALERALRASRRLQAIFQAAFDFGLTDEEVWEVVLEVTKRFPDKAPINESIDAMAEALAQKIEEKRGE